MDFRLYLDGDEQGIIDLLENVFNGWPKFDLPVKPLDHWKWKYQDNPYGSIVVVGVDNGRIIGCQHTLLKKLKVGSNIYLSGIGMDVALHPDHRGTGIYGKIRDLKYMEEQKKGVYFKHYVQSHPKLIANDRTFGNPLFPHRAFESLRIRDVGRHFKDKSLNNRVGYAALSWVNKINRVFDGSKAPEGLEIREISRFDETADNFWLKVKEFYKFIIVRDTDYLNWRYCDKRGGLFKIFSAKINDNMVGYLVARINYLEEDNTSGYIVDALVKPKHIEVAEALIGTALKYFDDSGVNVVKSWNLNNSLSRSFSRSGFVNNPERLHLTLRKESLVESDYKILLNSGPDETHFSIGDQDHI